MNQNPSEQSNFKFTFNRLPNVNIWIQEFELPEISLNGSTVPTRNKQIKLPAVSYDVSDLSITCIVDEDFGVYKDALDWISEIVRPNQAGTNNSINDITSDGELIILDNNKNPINKFKFNGCWPINIGPLTFTNNDDNLAMIIFTMQLSIETFDFK